MITKLFRLVNVAHNDILRQTHTSHYASKQKCLQTFYTEAYDLLIVT